MVTFEHFFYEKHSIPPVVTVKIEGIGDLNAKADTGNDGYNVLHATDIRSDGKNVQFMCGDQQFSLPVCGNIMINKGPQTQEDRHVVKLNMSVNNNTYRDVPFTISDRSGMSEPVLLSKKFIAQMNSVVDPSLTSDFGSEHS